MKDLQEQVRDWWNKNPYTYGLSQQKGYRDVGDLPDEKLDKDFFDKYMRKVRKHFDDAQLPGEKIASRFIRYDQLAGKQALDIACGFGWGAVELASAGAFVNAIDVTPRAIDITRRHFECRSLQGDFQVMDAQDLRYPDHTFDFVLAWGCLMHMPDTERAIAEIWRVLKPSGKVFGYMYNKNSISYWWNFWFVRGVLMGKLWEYRGNTQRLVSRYTDGESFGGNFLTKVYTPKEAAAMFEKAKFKEVKFQPWGPPSMIHAFPFRKLPLGQLLPYAIRKAIAARYGWGMVFTAVKPAA
ncbi:MAG TPA: methyltransferase domain-containing protein [Anaerolineales bacterium]|nr:methyltransferase domain-containing protein [Anaerolineales bacterium]